MPTVETMPTLESVLNDLDFDDGSTSDLGIPVTPSPSVSISMEDQPRIGSLLRHVVLQGVTTQVSSAAVSEESSKVIGILQNGLMLSLGSSRSRISFVSGCAGYDSCRNISWSSPCL